MSTAVPEDTRLPAKNVKEQKLSSVRDFLLSCKKQVEAALPQHLTADRMIRITFSAVQRQPLLLECTTQSLALAVIQCSECGLEPALIGHAYLVPFYNSKRSCYECQFIPGYKGLIKLARNTGQLDWIYAEVVREGDDFKFARGTKPFIHHIPSDKPNGKITHAYSVAKLKDCSEPTFDIMSMWEIQEIKKRSPAVNSKKGPSGPWVTDEAEMCKKTVIRRHAKVLPASPELERAIVHDERAEAGLPAVSDIFDLGEAEIVGDNDSDTPPPETKADKVRGQLNAGKPRQQQPKEPATEIPMLPPPPAEFPHVFDNLFNDAQREKYDEVSATELLRGLDPKKVHDQAYAAALKLT